MTYREARRGDEPAVQAVVSTVLAEYGLTIDLADTDSDLQDIVGGYIERDGTFQVLENPAGRIVGCGGLYRLGVDDAEIRKMYLLREARGHGLGRTLLEDLVRFARVRGYKRIVLETASVLTEAIALYRRFGFVETSRDHLARRCDKAFRLDL